DPEETRVDRRTIGAIAGIAGPLLFVAVFTIEGWLRPDYDARRMYLSELALGPRGLVQIATLVTAGVLTILFARGVATEFPAARGGVRAVYLVGIGFVGGGGFVMDPLTTSFGERHWHGILHGVFGVLIIYGVSIAPLRFPREFRRGPPRPPFGPWGIAAAAATILLAFALPFVVELQRTGRTRNLPGGVIQRTHHIVYLAWQVAVATRLLRPRAPATQGAAAPEARSAR